MVMLLLLWIDLLQDCPDEIPEFVPNDNVDGYDLVSGWKQKRYDPISKTIPTKLFNYEGVNENIWYLSS